VKSLHLFIAELKAQMTPLMHADLIKERSEGGTTYTSPKASNRLKKAFRSLWLGFEGNLT
jgi:hypothetical protein